MYSMILSMVDTSLSGLSGSGAMPTHARRQVAPHVGGVGHAGEGHAVVEPQAVGEVDDVVEGVTAAEERGVPVVAALPRSRARARTA